MAFISDFAGPDRGADRLLARQPACNAAFVEVEAEGAQRAAFLMALRDVRAGETLLCDYGDSYGADHNKGREGRG